MPEETLHAEMKPVANASQQKKYSIRLTGKILLIAAGVYISAEALASYADQALRRAGGGIGSLHYEGFDHEKAMGILGLMGEVGRRYYLDVACWFFGLACLLGIAFWFALMGYLRNQDREHRGWVMLFPVFFACAGILEHGCIVAILLLFPHEIPLLGFIGGYAGLFLDCLLLINFMIAAFFLAQQAINKFCNGEPRPYE